MFILLFRVHLTDIFNLVFAVNPLVRPVFRMKLIPPLLTLQPVFFCRCWGLSSCKALEHKASTYTDPTGHLLNSEPFLLLPPSKARRDMAQGKADGSLT